MNETRATFFAKHLQQLVWAKLTPQHIARQEESIGGFCFLLADFAFSLFASFWPDGDGAIYIEWESGHRLF